MAEQLYFSRDTRMFVQFRNSGDNDETTANLGKGGIWEIPVLDGYSFSQTTNTSEITLAEMESTAGISRRGRRMFTDSLAPAEWSFSTYIRPFKSLGGSVATGYLGADGSGTDVHAVEEVLWASMFGADTWSGLSGNNSEFTRTTNPKVSGGDVLTPAANYSNIEMTESNRSALNSFTIWFWIDTSTSNPLMYRLPESVVNEVGIDFDVDGIATLNWSGFSKEVQDYSGNVIEGTTAPAYNATTKDGGAITRGDVFIDTDNTNGRAFHLVLGNTSEAGASSGVVTITQAIDEATNSTKNFIRNRLTAVEIEAATSTDKVPSIFPGNHDVITTLDDGTDDRITVTGHGFTTGDQVYITGCTNVTDLNGTHHFVNVVDSNNIKLYTTKAYAEAGHASTGLVAIAADGSYTDDSGTIANGKYNLVLTGGNFTIGNNITYLVPEELGAINKPLEHVTGTRSATGSATCYITLNDSDLTNGTSRQFFNDMVSESAMGKVVNKFKVTMYIGGKTAADDDSVQPDPAFAITFPAVHITVPTHQVEDIISLETSFEALPTDFGAADEISQIRYYPPSSY